VSATYLIYSTSSFALPLGQFRVLQLASFVPLTFHPMLLRVWNWTDHAVAVAERAVRERMAETFILKNSSLRR
jgi:hypothetical protein